MDTENLEIKDIRMMFDHGLLTEAVVSYDFGIWNLYFKKKGGGMIFVQTQRGKQREYKTIVAATRQAHEIGFRNISTQIHDAPRQW